ncbi:carboxypeptidase-like regulatory domain-containing protein [Oceanospirillum sediminis]|uniref:Carboxypeptidase regulatory-like domain-containing protein n=1 Tax=Oceanospirillum sediminis TaxID=2760088 RepID=A0A839ITS1_9GAMM|nr:carboxypeptidase-like regulatory domain-containing protein [Oceanospirillum sediminis]MBB1488853.1 carboxypeptidase regulatory-like domain-containing protein [Oceanospirillum sediminis]
MCLFAFNSALAEEEPVIFDVYAGRYLLAQSLFGYQRDEILFIPVSALADALGIPYHLELAPLTLDLEKTAANNMMQLSEADNKLKLSGVGIKETIFPENAWLKDYVEFDAELFIQAEYLEKIWPLSLEFKYRDMLLSIEPRGFIPKIEAIKRDEYRKQKLKKRADRKSGRFHAGIPYSLLSAPILDWNWRYSSASNSHSFLVQGRGDLLGMGNRWNLLSGNKSDPRLTYWKSAYQVSDDDAQPPLAGYIKSLSFGDITTQSISDVFPYSGGTGVNLSTFRRSGNIFDKRAIVGQAPDKWEAELYINQQLIDFQTISSEGIYQFDVELVSGMNQITVRLYGPYGEERVDNHSVVITPNYLKKGEWGIAYSYIKTTSSISSMLYDQQIDSTDAHLVTLGLGLGLDADFRFNLISRQDESGELRTILGGDINGYLSDIAWRFRGYFTDTAATYSFSFDKKGDGLSYSSGVSDRSQWPVVLRDDKDVIREAYAGLNYSLNDITIPVTINNRVFFKEAISEDIWSLDQVVRFRLGHWNLAVNNSCDFFEYTESLCTPSAILRYRLGGFKARLLHQKEDKSDDYQQSLDLFIPHEIWPEWICKRYVEEYKKYCEGFGLGVNYQSSDESLLDLRLIWSGKSNHFSVGSELNWNRKDGAGFNLSVKGSLLPAKRGGYTANNEKLSYPAFGRIYHDENNNGTLDTDEKLISKKRFYQRGSISDFTNAEGVWMDLKSLSQVSLVMTDFEDPYRISPVNSIDIPVRPERVAYIDWPVIDTGSVEGMLSDSQGRPLSAVHLVLLDKESADQVAEMYTAYDGFFVMDFIPPGQYILYMRTEKEQIELARPEVSHENLWVVVNPVYQSG